MSLIALAVVLLIASAATAVVGLGRIGELKDEKAALQSDVDARTAKQAAAAKELEEKFNAAGLPTRLQKIKDLDKAADAKFDLWKAGTAKFGELNTAMQNCDNEIDEYNRAAAPFPAEKFSAALPQRIDLENRETDCGRGFTSSI